MRYLSLFLSVVCIASMICGFYFGYEYSRTLSKMQYFDDGRCLQDQVNYAIAIVKNANHCLSIDVAKHWQRINFAIHLTSALALFSLFALAILNRDKFLKGAPIFGRDDSDGSL